MSVTRRDFLSTALAAPVFVEWTRGQQQARTVRSPNGKVTFELLDKTAPWLSYRVLLGTDVVIDPSALTMLVDGTDLCQNAAVGSIQSYGVNERYPWWGAHAEAVNVCQGARIAITHRPTRTAFTLDVRAYDDGVAFRFLVPGSGSRVPDESTEFVIPVGSTVWYHGLRGHYEDDHDRNDISAVPAGQWAAPPLTFKLPGRQGYGSITESAVINYAGMAFITAGGRSFKLQLGHAHPASYPYTLRYGEENARRLALPASVEGAITTPWRVVMVASDLNTLVNSDIVHNLAPRPDAKLFPRGARTDWIKPGRALWKYLDGGGENSLETMKEFNRMAGELGFEYHVVEGFWARWPEAQQREMIEHARQHKVGIWLWKHSRDLRTPQQRKEFFDHVQRIGAVGVKIDFLDHEAKEVMDLYQLLLQDAAEHKIFVNFHGANKPTGEARTWPNELTREAVSGMERRSQPAWATHNTTIPFTRMLAGHLDFTPMVFGERRKETSWAHQIATAAIFNSPALIYGAHPKSILENPAVELIKSIPSVWDETRVLPPSEIGELAVFARRRGTTWFLAILNGSTERKLDVPLSFLGSASYKALIAHDDMTEAGAIKVAERAAKRTDAMPIELRSGGGFVTRFS